MPNKPDGCRLLPTYPIHSVESSELPTVTAEVASSSLVVPAILFKELVFISAKPLRAQKGRAARPYRVPLPCFPLVTWRQLLASLHLRIQERRKRRPTTVLRPVLHASQG